MAYDKDQEDFSLPDGNNSDRSASNFLPKFFRTETNKKFINSTIDQMINPGVVEKIDAFAGRRYAKATTAIDNFLPDFTSDRENYQFEPVTVYKDELDNVEFLKNYNDYISQLKNFKGSVNNHSSVNSQEFYAWDPHIDWDKFVNFREYYWLPTGPSPISVTGQAQEVVSTYTVTLSDEGDNFAYVFTPNGFTRNPLLKLYRGQTYRFEIDTPGHPWAIAVLRNFVDNDLTDGTDFENVSVLYKDGVTSDTDYVESGTVEFTVPINSPDKLYYISENNINTSGVFAIFDIEANTEIDIDNEIVGKKTYKTSNGVELSNGMKLFFQGTVTPEKYATGFWYVEGVGSRIQLVSEKDLEVPSIFTSNFEIPFDDAEIGFDEFPFETATSYPGTKDYIVINRASPDRNPWTRYNRWFHRDILEECLACNNLPINIDEEARAKRPIIEFEAGLTLYQHGAKAKQNVDIVDTFTADVFSTIEGSLGYNVDGVDLIDGMRILFTADRDVLVNGKIYEVNFILHNGRRQISLIETDDTNPALGEVVLSLGGLGFAGKMFYYDGEQWNQSQDKTSVNQAPLFSLYSKDGNEFDDTLIYPATSFKGNKLFSYRIGTGSNDIELGFPLSYKNIANVGDIVFDFNLLQGNFVYQVALHKSQTIGTDVGYLKKYDVNGEEFTYVNAWKKAAKDSEQPVIRQYDTQSQLNNFAIDVFNKSFNLSDLRVKVSVNSERKSEGTDYTIIDNGAGTAIVKFTNDVSVGDVVLLKCFSSADKNDNGFYEIPINLERNPLNENITDFTLGQVNDHLDSIIDDAPNFRGTYPGKSNLRDIGPVTKYGKRFVQHSGPVNLALYHITDKNANLVKSLQFARKEYAKFKRKFINESTTTGFQGSIKEHVDLLLSRIVKDKISSMPFYFSDMIGIGAFRKTVNNIEFAGPAYFGISQGFDLETLSQKAISVYQNGIQLLHERDYVFADGFVYVTINLQDGDVVEIYEYETSNGSYIPPTPTKLGLFPKYEPAVYTDNTYVESQLVIRGHDGSQMIAFGDYRDDLLIELETRIYNNIKTNNNRAIIDIDEFVGGYSRETGFSKDEIDNVILSDFAQWLEISGSPDYSAHDFWDQSNSFTYNYSSTTDRYGNSLPGFWRAIYEKYYDTDSPHTSPWEMVGFTIKPTWWEEVYGPAPYTSNNRILWNDIQEGIIREPNKSVIRKPQYKRPDLLKFLPVDEFGRLLSPLQSGIAQNFSVSNSKGSFVFGDHSPTETAWRRSSEYAFSLITAWVVLQPTKIIGLGFDTSRIIRDITGNIIYKDTGKAISLDSLVIPTVEVGTTPLVLTSGLVNYVANYMVTKTIARYNDYKTILANLDNQLAIKLGGYADKTKLKLVLDSRSPLNKTSVFVPEENYQINFTVSSAIDIVVFSGIIIEKTELGYIISGYDKENPVFSFNRPIVQQSDPAITVGGISESFVTWNERQEYNSGTVVEYQNRYYRTRISHTSGTSFDSGKFVVLPSLPIVGGITANLRKSFEKEISRIPYGTQLSSVQEVVDFMSGYENYLVEQGFRFDFYNNDTEALEDMRLCIQEFMFWVTQNWDDGTVLTVSPVANKVLFERKYFVVDDIYDSFYDYNLLTGDGNRINRDFSNIFRDNANEFGVKPVNSDEGIFLVKLPLVQKEHVILVDNNTVFNDTIFDKKTGYRQERIKVVGYRTDDWTGGLNAPGFIYDTAKVTLWKEWTDYAIGDVVKYKEFYYSSNQKHTSTDFFDANYWNILPKRPESELLPNWDYRVNQFTDFYSLDTDNFDSEQQRLGQHLIGYQKREYLANIIPDSVSQYKFYQGFIQDKGTLNSLTKLFDALSSANKDSLEFFEEWAIRLGQYGSVNNLQEVEFNLNEGKYRLEPQLIELVDNLSSTRTDLVYEFAPYQTYIKPDDYDHQNLFTENVNSEMYVKDSGYVRDKDVSFLAISDEQLLQLSIDDILIGEFVWIKDQQQSWTVSRYVNTEYEIVNIEPAIPDDEFLPYDPGNRVGFVITLDKFSDFEKDEVIGIKSGIPDINGFFKVTYASLDKIVILTDSPVNVQEFTDSSTLAVTRFVRRRFDDADDLNSNITDIKVDLNDRIWLDDTGESRWGVYENENIYSLLEEIPNPTGDGDGFATSFDAIDNNSIIIMGAPERDLDPVVRIYRRFAENSVLTLLQAITATDSVDSNSLFGFDVSISSNGEFIAVGAPHASNAKTFYDGDLVPGERYEAGYIVKDRNTFWRALVSVNPAPAVISPTDTNWEQVNILEASSDSGGIESGLTRQGVVFLYEKAVNSTYTLKHIITSPDPTDNERFGYKVELRRDALGRTRLFVGAPGEENISKGRIYFFDNLSGEFSWTADSSYRGIYNVSFDYYAGEIVYTAGEFKKAIVNAPGAIDSIDWETLVTTDYPEHTGFIPRPNSPVLSDSENGVYADATNIGDKFTVNRLGDVLAVAAIEDDIEKIIIYRFVSDRFGFSQKIDTDDSLETFGYVIALNEQGNKLAVAAPRNDDEGIDSGVVYIYDQNDNTQYEIGQTLRSPFDEKNEAFGTGVSFYGNKVAISGKNTDTRIFTTFDNYFTLDTNFVSSYVFDQNTTRSEVSTTYDGGTTRFMTKRADTGRIALFQQIGNAFIFAEDINYNRDTKFNSLSNFKLIDNHIYIGLPKLNPALTNDDLVGNYVDNDSTVGMFVDMRAERNANSWTLITQEDGKIDISKISRCFLYSKDLNDIIAELDIVDPRQGKIAGPAEQELDYKTFYDPAVYSINTAGVQGVVVDSESNWTDKQVGQLWWDLSTVSWYNPYQGESQYRANNWNRITPGSSVDVYEWISTDLLPSDWNRLADTNEGFAKNISGTTLYGNSVYSSKRVYDNISRTFSTKYFYWVKNKRIVPQLRTRRLSAFDVAEIIRDPANSGYRFVAPLDTNKFAIYNSRSFVEGTNTILHFSFAKDPTLQTNLHREYQLVTEGLDTSIINVEVQSKWVDSLVGYDQNNNNVPDPELPVKQKYGILNFPRQSMFINRLEAVKQVVERVNDVLVNTQVVDGKDFTSLLLKDEPPLTVEGKYDSVIDSVAQLRFVGVAKVEQAILEPVIENTRIVGVNIINSGRGYSVAPTVKISDNKGASAVIQTTINNLGQVTSVNIKNGGKNYTSNTKLTVRKFSVLVNSDEEIGGRWAIYTWDKTSQEWSRSDNQAFDTTRYWDYADWYAEGYSSQTAINRILAQTFELASIDAEIGDIIKVESVGSGGWLLLRKVDDQFTQDFTVNFETIGRQDGTIQLSTRLYDYASTTSGFDSNIYDSAFYDREPVVELRNILTSLRDDLFIGDLAVEWNKLFFASMRYAFSEQADIDWAFKTSFVRAKHNLGELTQKVTFQNDNLENYEDYVNEVKPYKTKVREYISSYEKLEPTETLTTDFDLPPSYDAVTRSILTNIATQNGDALFGVGGLYFEEPFNQWTNNNGYEIVRIDIADAGQGYLETPTIEIEGNKGTVATAFVSRGTVRSIEIENTGSTYYTAPTINIVGAVDQFGRPAKAVAILGNGKVRGMHMTIKFDRVSGSYLFTELDKTETFVGTSAREKFELQWPMSVNTSNYTIIVNGIEQLESSFDVGNDLDTSKGYDRFTGFIDFAEAPGEDAVIEIQYKKEVSLLQAADRINFFYNPTTGMLGKDLSQLMDGVEYSGVQIDSFDFGNEQGWDVAGWASLPWDTFDDAQDEVFVLDGSTVIFELSQPLEDGAEYNFYRNGIRLDDPVYDGSTPTQNPNAIMQTIVGDGVTTTITISEEITTEIGDLIVIRKSTSDGASSAINFDTQLEGGNLAYSTATGIDAGEINIDGDGFVTPTTSKGPEELVPGEIVDTLDIRVYHRPSEGIGVIATANYRLDGVTTEFPLPGMPQSNEGIIVKINNVILGNDSYSIDFENELLLYNDNNTNTGASLAITTIGTNGADLIDTNTFVSDGSTITFVTSATWTDELSALVLVNGEVAREGYTLLQSDATDGFVDRLKIVFAQGLLAEGDFVQYSVYGTNVKTYSEVIIDRTFIPDGITKTYQFDGEIIPVPFSKEPISHNILVKVDNTILNPGYSVSYTTTASRVYDIEEWQFTGEDLESVDVLVFADYVQLSSTLYSFDPLNVRVELLTPDVAPAGTRLDIYVIKNAEYYFVDTQIEFDSDTISNYAEVGGELTLESLATSTIYTGTIVSVNSNIVVIQSIREDIRDAFINGDQFVASVDDADSTVLTVDDVIYTSGETLTFAEAPAADSTVEIYQFSNHDVNNFERFTYKVVNEVPLDISPSESTTRNLISSGYIPLRGTITNANYAWVALNGTLLTPNVDYSLAISLDAVQLTNDPEIGDVIDVIQFGAQPVTKKFGYRIFKDMLNRTHYKRLNQDNSYKLASPLNYYDVRIVLEDTSGIFQPDKTRNIPGVLFIEGERIEYFEVQGNTVRQLRRGTLGTGVRDTYNEGIIAYGQGPEENINYNDTTLTQIIMSDGSIDYELNFTPSSINEIDVFVGGRRLRKVAVERFNPSIAQDSPAGDETLAPEYILDGNMIILDSSLQPAPETQVRVLRKIGKVWNESGKSLARSKNAIGNFLREATIELPK